MSVELHIVKRNGSREQYEQGKLHAVIDALAFDLDKTFVNTHEISTKVSSGMCQGMSTKEIVVLSSETAADMTTAHPHYANLAGRISVMGLHKETPASFLETVILLNSYRKEGSEETCKVVADEVVGVARAHAEKIEKAIDYRRDFLLSYFGIKTLEKSYLLRINKRVVERPQHMFMRVAIGIHGEDVDRAIETYELMSTKHFVHATPTLFNSGTINPQMSSCYLLAMREDSIDGIYSTLRQCALISKDAGGIGLNIQNVRAKNSYIRGTFGNSNGIIPMLRVFGTTSSYVDQGGNKRPGSFATYLEPWHADVFEFIDLKKNTGKDETRAKELFPALWIPDLFMERVERDMDWSLFCPDEAQGLADVYGEEFVALYEKYEKEGRARKQVPARRLWRAIVDAEVETGTPYILYKDSCNRKSNQKNLGTIKGSNLCAEIVEYTSKDEVAVCNLASIALPSFIQDGKFNLEKLKDVAKVVARNLNKVIDINKYPVEEARTSNMKHRPIGIGVQGLADTYVLLGYPFESEEAARLNVQIFETIYFGALESSMELAREFGPYESFKGSPASVGILQYDMWGVAPSRQWNWSGLKEDIARHGLRNSLLIALMPTASTSQILGYNECFEGFTSNIYARRTLSGEFQVVNHYLVNDLAKVGLWGHEMKNLIIKHEGSIQDIQSIPENIKSLYKTVWEISQKAVINQAADRGAFVDQSQSMNIHMATPTFSQITSMHFHAWKRGLKTGTYYLRTQPAQAPIKFTLDAEVPLSALSLSDVQEGAVCTFEEGCLSCGS
jgi:ribonucleoside-diphosphate reductase alpha subunit